MTMLPENMLSKSLVVSTGFAGYGLTFTDFFRSHILSGTALGVKFIFIDAY